MNSRLIDAEVVFEAVNLETDYPTVKFPPIFRVVEVTNGRLSIGTIMHCCGALHGIVQLGKITSVDPGTNEAFGWGLPEGRRGPIHIDFRYRTLRWEIPPLFVPGGSLGIPFDKAYLRFAGSGINHKTGSAPKEERVVMPTTRRSRKVVKKKEGKKQK